MCERDQDRQRKLAVHGNLLDICIQARVKETPYTTPRHTSTFTRSHYLIWRTRGPPATEGRGVCRLVKLPATRPKSVCRDGWPRPHWFAQVDRHRRTASDRRALFAVLPAWGATRRRQDRTMTGLASWRLWPVFRAGGREGCVRARAACWRGWRPFGVRSAVGWSIQLEQASSRARDERERRRNWTVREWNGYFICS